MLSLDYDFEVNVSRQVSSKRELDLIWKTFKHFGGAFIWRDRDNNDYINWSTAEVLQHVWELIEPRDRLFRELEMITS